jgi:hypothetical protein
VPDVSRLAWTQLYGRHPPRATTAARRPLLTLCDDPGATLALMFAGGDSPLTAVTARLTSLVRAAVLVTDSGKQNGKHRVEMIRPGIQDAAPEAPRSHCRPATPLKTWYRPEARGGAARARVATVAAARRAAQEEIPVAG